MAFTAASTGTLTNFIESVLSSKHGAIPRGSLWIAAFEDLPNKILPGIKLALSYEPGPKIESGDSGGESLSWSISKAAGLIAASTYQETAGCVLCQAIDIPGETIQVNAGGNIVTNSFIRSYVGGGRADFPEMRMTFLDTNLSFADNVLRPWSISTATFGMVARDPSSSENYRTNLTCWQLTPYSSKLSSPTVIKTITFYGVCCVSVNNEELNYYPATEAVEREAKFVYHYYTVNTTSDNDFINPNHSAPNRR